MTLPYVCVSFSLLSLSLSSVCRPDDKFSCPIQQRSLVFKDRKRLRKNADVADSLCCWRNNIILDAADSLCSSLAFEVVFSLEASWLTLMYIFSLEGFCSYSFSLSIYRLKSLHLLFLCHNKNCWMILWRWLTRQEKRREWNQPPSISFSTSNTWFRPLHEVGK